MKLLLTSAGLSNKSIKKAFFKLVGKPAKDIKLVFVPTASHAEFGNKQHWLIKDLIVLTDMKFKEIDIADFSAVPKDMWLKKIKAADVIFVEGGNTYHLVYWMKKSGFDKVLKSLKKQVYVGVSAGSMSLGEKISTSPDRRYYSKEIGKHNFDDGLGLVNFSIRPHHKRPNRAEYTEQRLQNIAKKFKTTLYALDDNSAIVVDGKKTEVVSEGEWEKFK